MRTSNTKIAALDLKTMKAVSYDSIKAAAKGLKRDYSTVRRAATGDRGIMTCAGKVLIPFTD